MKSWYRLPVLMLFLSVGIQCRSAGSDQAAPPSAAQQQQEQHNGDTISKTLFPNGRTEQLILKKDSSDFRQLIYTFYENGKIKEKGHQGYYSGKEVATGIYAGTWYRYDTTGKLMETTVYHNDEPAKAYIEKTRYYANGRPKAIERFSNYELYESDIDSIGDWKYFDEQGQLIRTVHHKSRP